MTTPIDFDRCLMDWLDEAGAPQTPEYFDELLDRTRRTRQRPAWASLERWLPVQLTMSRRAVPVPGYAWLLLLALFIALFVAVVVGLGGHRLPAPIGPAGNGLIALDANGRISIVTSDGSDERFLTPDDEVDIDPVWSSDGTRLAFYSFPIRADAGPECGGGGPPLCDSPDRPTGSIMTMNADGENRRELVTGVTLATGFVAPIAWSHDGTKLAFSYRAPNTDPAVDVIDVNGSRIFHVDRGAWPTWSPDDRWIAYQMPSLGVGMGAIDGSVPPHQVSQVYGTGFAFAGPAWSPDGKRLAFYAGGDGMHDVYTVGVDGADERAISATPADEYWPMWSPDGTQFVYERVGDFNNDIHFVVSAGELGSQRVLDTPLFAGFPTSWSPDGRYLVGHLFDDAGLSGVMLVNVAEPSKSITFGNRGGGLAWQRVAP